MDRDTIEALHTARAAEREQAEYYRALAAEAEARGDGVLAERLNGLHADEQHHVSRLTARLLELGEPIRILDLERGARPDLGGWERRAKERERDEIERYRELLERPLDEETAERVREILEAEEQHARTLDGKWMNA